jgi:hypothetical protein
MSNTKGLSFQDLSSDAQKKFVFGALLEGKRKSHDKEDADGHLFAQQLRDMADDIDKQLNSNGKHYVGGLCWVLTDDDDSFKDGCILDMSGYALCILQTALDDFSGQHFAAFTTLYNKFLVMKGEKNV